MKRKDIEKLLPQVIRRASKPGTVLCTLLAVMEALHEPAEQTLERLPLFFAPHAAPPSFVPLLATWVDLDWLWRVEGRSSIAPAAQASDHARNLSCGLGRVRDLVGGAAFLSKWRGSCRGLCCFLELATGMKGFQIDESVPGPDGRPLPYHIRIRVPGKNHHRALIERIVQEEKPAYVTFELSFEGQQA